MTIIIIFNATLLSYIKLIKCRIFLFPTAQEPHVVIMRAHLFLETTGTDLAKRVTQRKIHLSE